MSFPDHTIALPRTMTRRQALAALAGIAGVAVLPTQAVAQSGAPVRMIVTTSAGAGLDATFRTAQSALGLALGGPLVIDNQAGAGGLIGMQALSRSTPDGSVLGTATNNLVILPSVMKVMPIDISKDLTPIAIIGAIPLVLVVNAAKIPSTNAKEFIALLKSKGNTLNYGSSGSGTVLHIATEMFLDEVGVKVNHIPYKGVAPMINDLLGGQVDFVVSALPIVLGHIKSGKLRAIGVCTAQRVPAAPEIPTLAEQGLPNYVAEAWVSVLGPKGMSPAVVTKVHDAVATAFNDPAVKDALTKQGTVVNVTTPEEAQATIRRDLTKYGALAKKVGLEMQ